MALVGFAWLFACYHAAEYFVIFNYKPQFFLLLQGLFFASAWLIARMQGYQGLTAWGIIGKKSALKNLATGLLAGGLVYTIYFICSVTVGFENVIHIPAARDFAGPFLLFTFGTFFSSLSEDVLTRGYVFRHIGHALSTPLLTTISALVYVLNHIYRLQDGLLVWTYLFIIGIFLMLALVRTGNIWLTLGLHWSGNIVYQTTHQVIETNSTVSGNQGMLLYISFLLLLIPLTLLLSKKGNIKGSRISR